MKPSAATGLHDKDGEVAAPGSDEFGVRFLAGPHGRHARKPGAAPFARIKNRHLGRTPEQKSTGNDLHATRPCTGNRMIAKLGAVNNKIRKNVELGQSWECRKRTCGLGPAYTSNSAFQRWSSSRCQAQLAKASVARVSKVVEFALPGSVGKNISCKGSTGWKGRLSTARDAAAREALKRRGLQCNDDPLGKIRLALRKGLQRACKGK